MPSSHQPVLLILAGKAARELGDLFSRRGFSVYTHADVGGVRTHLAGAGPTPILAIVDHDTSGAAEALALLHAHAPRPALVGIAAAGTVLDDERLDAAFSRPMNPARLFALVVKLVARRKGGGRKNRITGIVAVVRGNALFHVVEKELHDVVPPVNAGAILEKALMELGADPRELGVGDLAAMLASGRLAEALRPFGDWARIQAAVRRIAALIGADH